MQVKIAFVGQSHLGGARMRGRDVARELGVPYLDLRELKITQRWDTLVLIKYWFKGPLDFAATIRQCCDRLIFDPLDCWSSTKYNAEPESFWKWTRRTVGFDEVVACSPAQQLNMERALPHSIPVHLAPHHADRFVGPNWYSPDGHVAYAGGRRFIESRYRQIESACKFLGRQFKIDEQNHTPKVLQGAALCLNLRLSPHDNELNRLCKPQVKLENCAAAGLPCLASDHPCTVSLNVWRKRECQYSDQRVWAAQLAEALLSPKLSNPVTLEEHCDRMQDIIECKSGCLISKN